MLIDFERQSLLNMLKAGFISATSMLLLYLFALRAPNLPRFVRLFVGCVLLLPGALVFLSAILHKGHDIGYGYFYAVFC
jgi:hypothetical protein